jgi:hypothetical protein
MINDKVTLVLGAGASAPYGFPLGTSLMLSVISKLNNQSTHFDQKISTVLSDMGFDYQAQRMFINELRGAHQPSIDAFLQERGQEFLGIGKAAIAAALIPYEDLDGLLSLENELSATVQNQRWYGYLLNLMGTYRDFGDNHLSIITFNYDRSLEYFLFNAIKHRFNLNDEKALRLLQTIPIVHVYGQLGKFDFHDPTNGRPYSTELSVDTVKRCIHEIHLMYDIRDEGDFVRSNQESFKLIQSAHRLIFFGFGYHEKNLERLKLREFFTGEDIIAGFYGRKAGETDRDLALIEQYSPPGIPVQHREGTVLEILQNTNYLR